MNIPTDEEIKKWRSRWDDPNNHKLLEEVLKFMYENKPNNQRDFQKGIATLCDAGKIMEKAGFPPVEYKVENYPQMDIHEKGIPCLDLRGAPIKIASRLFLQYAHLEGALLFEANFKDANLNNVHLEKADARGAIFSGAWINDAHLEYADCESANINGTLMNGTHLEGANLESASLTYCRMNNSFLQEANLSRTKLQNAEFYNAKYDRKTKFQFINLAHVDRSSNILLFREIEDLQFLTQFRQAHPKWYKLWSISCDCGRSMIRWTVISASVVLLFAFIFLVAGQEQFHFADGNSSWSWFAPFYYSIVTFTTLGFGDITPKIGNWWLQMLVTIEVILGYIMLGGLISIFANKLARRA